VFFVAAATIAPAEVGCGVCRRTQHVTGAGKIVLLNVSKDHCRRSGDAATALVYPFSFLSDLVHHHLLIFIFGEGSFTPGQIATIFLPQGGMLIICAVNAII
jgi:hypothetical protein